MFRDNIIIPEFVFGLQVLICFCLCFIGQVIICFGGVEHVNAVSEGYYETFYKIMGKTLMILMT